MGRGRPISLFRGCAIEPNAEAKVAAQVPQTANGGGGDAGREAGNSGRVAVTAAHLKFQKVTSHPWHIRSICMRRQRTAGQGDKRTAEGHVTSLSSHSPKVTIFKYFRVFFALLLLKFLS